MSCNYDPIAHNGTPAKPYHFVENNESSRKTSGKMVIPSLWFRVHLVHRSVPEARIACSGSRFTMERSIFNA